MSFVRLAALFACAFVLFNTHAAAQQPQRDFGRVPLAFEANAGQTDARVKYLSRGEGYSLFLTATEAVLALNAPANRTATLRMTVVGANARPVIEGQQMLPGKTNYLVDPNPAKWRTDVSNYARVKYAAVYPGIDLVYYGNQRQLEYDFIVAPGADPAAIALRFDGSESMRLDAAGNLVLAIGGEHVTQPRPFVYQEVRGIRVPVAAGYVLGAAGRVTFDVAAYDRSLPLVIDPVLRYSTFLGGEGRSIAFRPGGVAVDSAGNAYVVGTTTSLDFPTTPGAFDTAARTHLPIAYVTKLNATGTAQIYSTLFGTSTLGRRIAVDHLGQAYITGTVYNLHEQEKGIPIVNGFDASLGESFETGFVAKFNSTGSGLLYSSYLDGSATPTSIAVDNAGYAYVSGFGPVTTTAGAFSTAGDAFVMKIDTAAVGAGSLQFATHLGGELVQGHPYPRPYDPQIPVALAIDSLGHVYVTGSAADWDGTGSWPTTPGAFDTTYNSTYSPEGQFIGDIFVMKLNPSGTGLVYSTFVGSGMWDAASGIAVDSAGNAYVAGMTIIYEGAVLTPPDAPAEPFAGFPTTPGAYRTTPYPGDGLVVTHGVIFKLNAAGSELLYSTYLGGAAVTRLRDMTVDAAGRVSPGQPSSWSATAAQPENGLPAIEAAYQVGNIVAQKILNGWATYKDQIPASR